MATLHQLLSASPGAWADCRRLFLEGDALLLADAGVCALWRPELVEDMRKVAGTGSLFVVSVDALARGVDGLAREAGVSLISDGDWVAKAVECRRVMSWK